MSFDNEMSLIGMCLKDWSLAGVSSVRPEHFTNQATQRIWTTMCQLVNQGCIGDMISISEIAGPDLLPVLSDAMRNTHTTRTWRHHHDGILNDYQCVTVANLLTAEHERVCNGDLTGLPALTTALASADPRTDANSTDAAHAATDVVNQIERAIGGQVAGMPWLIDCVQHAMGIMRNSDLIVVAARPAMGKTAFGSCLLPLDQPVGFISGEMSASQVAARLMAQHGDFRLSSLRQTPNQDDLVRAKAGAKMLAGTEIHILDKSRPTIGEVAVQARRWKYQYGIKFLLVDYIQLLRGDRVYSGKTEEVGAVVEGLKEIARTLELPVVALAQLNRSVESREDKRPLSGADIKDSGVIEQTADVICGLYRDEVYNPENPWPNANTAELIVIKNRHGMLGTIYLNWDGSRTLFGTIPSNHQRRIKEQLAFKDAPQTDIKPRKYADRRDG